MKKPNKSKPAHKRTRSRPPSEPTGQAPVYRSRWERFRNHPIWWAVGILGGLLAIGAPIYDAFSSPEIHADPAETPDPFSLRFSLRNPSWLLTMNGVGFSCILRNAVTVRNNSFVDVTLGESDLLAAIGAGATALYSCPYNRLIVGAGDIVRAQVAIAFTYRLAGVTRTKVSQTFNWDAASRHWNEGEIIN